MNLEADSANCGACGKTCPAGEVCSAGACSESCAVGFSVCTADGGAPFCANLQTDTGSCGKCGVACPAGEVCVSGSCAESCAAGFTACTGSNGAPFCADLQTDLDDCGKCGNACPSGDSCVAGKCAPSCAAGLTACVADGGAYCADVKGDLRNCGACGAACPAGQYCIAGACTEDCATGFTACGGADAGAPYCANLEADSENCGTCGAACAPGQRCVAGACAESCAAGFSACTPDGGAPYCAKLGADDHNCGSCGNACPSGQTCNGAGECAESCAQGYSACAGGGNPYCADLAADRVNCGTCGTICAPGQTCEGNSCLALSLTALTPPIATLGSSIVLTGTGFAPSAAGETVIFGTTSAPITAASATQITVTVPAGITGSVPVQVQNEGLGSNTLPFVVLASSSPIAVNGALASCSTNYSNSGRKVAVGANGWLYAGFVCGGNGYLSVSQDGGLTFSPPIAIPGFTGLGEMALQAGPGSTLYASAYAGGNFVFQISGNGGLSWGAAAVISSGSAGWLSMASLDQAIFLGAATSGFEVYGNMSGGMGAFAGAPAGFSPAFGDVLVDPSSGDVWAVGDTPQFHLAVSIDHGATFGPVTNLGPQVGSLFSDWTLGQGNILAAGSSDVSGPTNHLWVIPTGNLAGVRSIPGAMTGAGRQLAVTSDGDGNAYLVAQVNGAIQLQQWLFGAVSVSSPTTLAPAGSSPVLAPGPQHSVLVAYADASGKVWATVQVYP